MTDKKPFKHGEEGTHSVCNKHNIGGKSVCCECSGKAGCGDDLMTDKIKPTRCGACGDFTNPSLDELKLCSKEELDGAELVHCGCENQEEDRYFPDMWQ